MLMNVDDLFVYQQIFGYNLDMKRKNIQIIVNESTQHALKLLADNDRRSLSSYLAILLEAHVNKENTLVDFLIKREAEKQATTN